MITMLRRWWTSKYRQPWTPSNIEDFTILELLTEFYEDVFEKDKTALFEASRGEDGEIMFESTGDDLIDKWEQEIAAGLEPDMTEGMTAEDKAELSKEAATKVKARKQAAVLSDIDERYEQGLMENPMYTTKTAGEMTSQLSPLDLLGKGK